MKQVFQLITLLFVLIVSSCSGNESEETISMHQIVVLFSPNGLGDMGYNDNILKGLQTIRKERTDAEILFYTPATLEEAEDVFSEWISTDIEGKPSLFVLTTSDYEDMVCKYLKGKELQDGKDVLFFESSNPHELPLHHFQISMYGASYLAGVTAAHCTEKKSIVILGNSNDMPTWYAAYGFEDGYTSQADTESVTVHTLADDWSGYAKASETYQMMGEWEENYGFVYSVAGGSNAGIYRYLREFPDAVYTAGMDTDQSYLCSQIVGSMVKHIDVLIEDFIIQWIDTGTMPEETIYGLESGYIDWVLAPAYKDDFLELVNNERKTAIQKEKEYDKNI